jgi:cytochrome c-type biogenesis protein CcmH
MSWILHSLFRHPGESRDPDCQPARKRKTWVPAFAGMTIRVVAIAMLVAIAPALAVEPDEILKNPALEGRARALSAEFRCLVCQNQSIDDSEAPLARDLRLLIREHLVKGESDQEVKDFVVQRYGDFVLLKPRLTWRTLLLWATPFAVLLAALAMFLTRRSGPTDREGPLSEKEQADLRKALE